MNALDFIYQSIQGALNESLLQMFPALLLFICQENKVNYEMDMESLLEKTHLGVNIIISIC